MICIPETWLWPLVCVASFLFGGGTLALSIWVGKMDTPYVPPPPMEMDFIFGIGAVIKREPTMLEAFDMAHAGLKAKYGHCGFTRCRVCD